MLKAFKNRLKLMVIDPADSFTELLNRRVGAQEAPRYEQPLRNMIMVHPRDFLPEDHNSLFGMGGVRQ